MSSVSGYRRERERESVDADGAVWMEAEDVLPARRELLAVTVEPEHRIAETEEPQVAEPFAPSAEAVLGRACVREVQVHGQRHHDDPHTERLMLVAARGRSRRLQCTHLARPEEQQPQTRRGLAYGAHEHHGEDAPCGGQVEHEQQRSACDKTQARTHPARRHSAPRLVRFHLHNWRTQQGENQR